MGRIDKRDAAYSMARSDLMHEMLRGGLFDMDEHDRGENVAHIVRDLKKKYPELDEQMERRLVGEGMQRTYGDATWNEAERGRREAP
jgi:hypothetical protein